MLKVFLVEDERIIREGIKEMVPWEEYGFTFAGEAADGEMALPAIRKIRPDVVVTDIKMPFMDGLTLSGIVRKEFPDTKIVIISGHDDFAYAKKAINLGVEEYLLKPVNKNQFEEVLQKLRGKFQTLKEQRQYYEQYQEERQEYEKHSRQIFFEKLVSGEYPVENIYEDAAKLKMEVGFESYNIVLLSMNEHEMENGLDVYSKKTAKIQEKLQQLFAGKEDCILFRNQIFQYAVLVMGEAAVIHEKTRACVEEMRSLFVECGKSMEWTIGEGTPVERISQISNCYKEASKELTRRYMYTQEEAINYVDAKSVDPEIIRNFLSSGRQGEVEEFAHNYIEMAGAEGMTSTLFRQYVVLNVHFSSHTFLQQLGVNKEALPDTDIGRIVGQISRGDQLEEAVADILGQVIAIRDEHARKRYRSVLTRALSFMGEHFQDDDLSLNTVAREVNVSSNHFSALFSQEMGETFIEYLTGLRMKKAKELLRCSDMRSGEIALEVGYKDAHYFSFLFKKTQGCTPSEYRGKRG